MLSLFILSIGISGLRCEVAFQVVTFLHFIEILIEARILVLENGRSLHFSCSRTFFLVVAGVSSKLDTERVKFM